MKTTTIDPVPLFKIPSSVGIVQCAFYPGNIRCASERFSFAFRLLDLHNYTVLIIGSVILPISPAEFVSTKIRTLCVYMKQKKQKQYGDSGFQIDKMILVVKIGIFKNRMKNQSSFCFSFSLCILEYVFPDTRRDQTQ